jgi:adenylylsulfate kinase
MESKARSIVKAVSYRVLGSIATAGIFYALNHNLSLSLIGGAMDAVVKIGVYFVHERIWDNIDYGRPKPPEYEI